MLGNNSSPDRSNTTSPATSEFPTITRQTIRKINSAQLLHSQPSSSRSNTPLTSPTRGNDRKSPKPSRSAEILSSPSQSGQQIPDVLITVVGPSQVGKSALLKAISKLYIALPEPNITEAFLGYQCTDIRFIPHNKLLPQSPIVLRLAEVPESSISVAGDQLSLPGIIFGSDGVLLCYDVSNNESFVNMPALLDALTDIQLPVIMIGCKSDLKIEGRIDYKLGSKLSAVFGVYFRELSAETKPNDVAVVLEELFTLIVNGPVSRTEGPKYEALKKQLRKMRRESNALNGIATPVMKTPRLDSAKTSTRGNQTITPDSTPNAREIKSSSLHVPKTPSKTNSPRSYSVPAMKSQNGFTSLSEEAKATVQDKSKSNKNDLTDSLYPGSLSMGFTMDELIERMTCADVQDMEFTKVFLMLYRKFMRPSELLDRLLDRFDEFDNRDAIAHKSATVLHPVQIRVCNVLIHWISEYWADDFTSSKMCFTLEVFLQILHSRPSFAKLASIIQNLVWRDPAPTNENGAYVDWGAEDDDDTISMEEVKESPNPAVNSGRLSDQTIYSDLRAEKPTRERIEEEFSARDSNSLPRMARNGSSSISSFTNRANSWISSLSSNSSSLSRSSMDHRSPTDNAAAGIALQAAQLAGLGPHMSTSTVSTDAIRTLGTRRPSNGSFFSMLNQQYGTSSIDRKHSASSSDKYIWDQQNVRQSATTVAMSRYGDNNSNFSVSGWSTLANRRRSSAGSIDSASLNPAEMGSGITGLGTHMNESNISVFDYPFLEVDEFAIVQQLNLMEYEIFSQIKPRDLLQQIWSRKSKNRYAQSAVASIAHNNFISSWVSTRILSQKKVKSRAKLILKFMRIAKFLRDSNNYNSLFAVMGALSSAAISRLKLTWSYINHQKEEFVDFVQLEMLTNPNHRFQLYRAALRNSEGPCVPYLGVLFQDLLYIDEQNKDRKLDGNLNLAKFLLIGDAIMNVIGFQIRPYNVTRDPHISSMILGHPVMDENTAYYVSLELEPRSETIQT